MMKCPICGKGELKKRKIEFEMYGIKLGKFNAEFCDKCGEEFFDEEADAAIERKARKLGIWGLEKEGKTRRVGNAIAISIPKKIREYLNLKAGESVLLHPLGKNKIVIEIV
jgi:AbrB family looped-hinge helix DNA binding protein/YgiT-type zinc finger domain-containing protein